MPALGRGAGHPARPPAHRGGGEQHGLVTGTRAPGGQRTRPCRLARAEGRKEGWESRGGGGFFSKQCGGGATPTSGFRRGPHPLSSRAWRARHHAAHHLHPHLVSSPLLCSLVYKPRQAHAHAATLAPPPPAPRPLHFFRHRRQDQGRPRPRRQHAKDGKGQGLPRQPGRHAGGQVAGALLSCLGLFFKARGPSGTALSSTRARAVRGRRSPARACPGGRPWS